MATIIFICTPPLADFKDVIIAFYGFRYEVVCKIWGKYE